MHKRDMRLPFDYHVSTVGHLINKRPLDTSKRLSIGKGILVSSDL